MRRTRVEHNLRSDAHAVSNLEAASQIQLRLLNHAKVGAREHELSHELARGRLVRLVDLIDAYDEGMVGRYRQLAVLLELTCYVLNGENTVLMSERSSPIVLVHTDHVATDALLGVGHK